MLDIHYIEVLNKNHVYFDANEVFNKERLGKYNSWDEIIRIIVTFHPYLNCNTIIHECTHGEDRIGMPWWRATGWLQSLLIALINDLLEKSKQLKHSLSLPLTSEDNLRTPFEKEILTIINC
jgi:hypothetical protein